MNSRSWHTSVPSRNYLPDPNQMAYERATCSSSTSPSDGRYGGRRKNSRPERFLQAEAFPPASSRSQEDIRKGSAGYTTPHHFRPSPKERIRERFLPHLPSHFTDEDGPNTSTDDDLDVSDTRQKPRTRNGSSKLPAANYSEPSRPDERLQYSNSHSRTSKPSDPEIRERQRRTEHRRASLHLDVIRNCNDYSSSSSFINRNDHSPSPQQSNPTIQLHFGGQKVKDYNQYSTQLTSLSPRKSTDTPANDAERALPASLARASSSTTKDIPLNSAFHRLNCYGPSSQEQTSYY